MKWFLKDGHQIVDIQFILTASAMLFLSSAVRVVLALALIGVSSAHSHAPAGSVEFFRRANFHNVARRSLASCHDELSTRGGVYERARERRQRAANDHRRKRGLRESSLRVSF
jgi:hypothetical protein